jgi:hypothetical protein
MYQILLLKKSKRQHMTIAKQFQENKTLLNNSLAESLNAVSLLKETIVKMQRFELATDQREMEKIGS